jgi:hypothetical protein
MADQSSATTKHSRECRTKAVEAGMPFEVLVGLDKEKMKWTFTCAWCGEDITFRD